MTLEYEGYEFVGAATGQEGLALAEREAPDLVLLDVKMPGMDGIEVLERLRNMNETLPVIVVSGHGTISTAVEATNNTVLPLHRLDQVDMRRREGDAERAFARCKLRDPHELICGVDECLGWNAADVEAGAPQATGLDYHRVDAELSRPDRAHVAAGSRANYQKLARYVPHGLNRS